MCATSPSAGTSFKVCPCCSHVWETRDDFLDDPGVSIVGYQPHFADLKLGIFLFNHAACGSTIAIQAGRFADLYDGPVYRARATGEPCCPGYCFHQGDLSPCPQKCECAYVREILQTVKGWPKKKPAAV